MNMQAFHCLPRSRWRFVAAAGALLAASAAWSSSSGTATLGPISVQLIDLRPNDGITPTIAFQLQGLEGGVAASAGVTWPLDFVLRARYGPWWGTSIDASTAYSWGTAALSGGAADSPNGVTARLQGVAMDYVGAVGSGAAFASQVALLTQGASIGFTLSPWTSMVMSTDFSAQLITTKAEDTALSIAQMWLTDDSGTLTSEDSYSLNCAGPCNVFEQRTMSLTLANSSSQSLAGNWWLAADLGGTSFASPVPEPGAASLLLCGVALLGMSFRASAAASTRGPRAN